MRETRRLKLIIYFHNCLRVMEKYSMTFFVRICQVKRGYSSGKKKSSEKFIRYSCFLALVTAV